MASLRERILERVAGIVRRSTERVTGRLRSVVQPTPAPPRPAPEARPAPVPTPRPQSARTPPAPPQRTPSTPQRPQTPQAQPTPRADEPSWDVSVAPDPSRASVNDLVGQLASIQALQNDLVQRLISLGYSDVAKAVLGVPELPQPTPAPLPPLPEPPRPPELPPAPPVGLPPLPPEAGVPQQQEPPPEEPPPEEQEPERPPEKRYLLAGPAIRIGFFPPDGAWDQFSRLWMRMNIGTKRDPDDKSRGIEPGASFGADAIARGSPMDPGVRIPSSAFRSRDAFTGWAQQNGYKDGLSITVDGLTAAPGVVIGPMSVRDVPASRDRQDYLERSRQGVASHDYWDVPYLAEDE